MLKTVIKAQENSAVIVLPFSDLSRLGMSVGDEIELLKNDNEEVIVRSVKKNERTQKVLEKTREIINRRKSALLELGKGHE
jgi:antitoxin component of MazEF toxin-antitoxin module